MPKTVLLRAIGGPENLEFEEVATRAPEQGEAKLRVEAVGLNRAELMYMGGYYFEQPALPSRIGYEAAGVVEAVGPGVDASWVGKRVATVPGYSMNRNGVLGEEAIVPASALAEYPAKLSAAEGAAVWMQYVTAYAALVLDGGVRKGDAVLITAASSSVGLAAIQIVKAEGGLAIATTRRGNKRDALLAEGADHVIATEEEDLVERVEQITGGKLVRTVFDPVAGSFLEKLAKVTAREGTIFEYGALSMEPTPFPLMDAIGKAIGVRGSSLSQVSRDPEKLAKAKRYVVERLEDGRFKPKIAKSFPLAQAREAYQYLASNQQIGKVVITVP